MAWDWLHISPARTDARARRKAAEKRKPSGGWMNSRQAQRRVEREYRKQQLRKARRRSNNPFW